MAMPIPTPETVPLALTDLVQPRTSYMLSKIYGEAMCQQAGIPFTIVRPHNVYGPRMGLVHVLPELMQKAIALPRDGRLEVSSVNHRRAFCFIEDAVELLIRIAAAPLALGGTFNIGNEQEETSIENVARIVLRTVGRTDLELVPLPETLGSPSRRCPDMRHTIRMTAFRPSVGLTDGTSRTYLWYRDNVFSPDGISAT
jgi:nucleoside-diphosphate-sugar epimerase